MEIDNIIEYIREEKKHTLAKNTFIGGEIYPSVIVWKESKEIRFALRTGNDKRYWKCFEGKLKRKFPQVKCAYLSETDGSCLSTWVVKLNEIC